MSKLFKNIGRWFRRPKDTSGHVYYVRLNTPQGIFYKLGFTRKPSIEERMSYGGHGDESLIERKLLFVFHQDAWEIEQDLLEHFEKMLAFGKFSNDKSFPLAGRGQSELFKSDVLGLDDSLYASTKAEEVLEYIPADNNPGMGCLLTIFAVIFSGGIYMVILVLIGLAEIFGSPGTVSIKEGQPNAKRPQHPKRIQDLIDSLRT